MTKYTFLTARFRSTLSFRLTLLIPVVLCLAVSANAQEKTASGLIEAVVIDVQGTNLTIAGGITIDISRAVIISVGGERLDISIKPGMTIRANIGGSDEGASTFVADIIRVQPEDRIVFSGVLQEVDLDNGHITILNRRVLITSETSIPVGFKQRKLKAALPVSVIVKPSGDDLVATVIFPKIVLPNIFP